MKTREYLEYDGLGLAELVRRRGVSTAEVVEVAWNAVDQLNPRLNAVVDLFRAEVEQELCRGLPDGPFTGVPFLIKDLGLSYAGKRTSMGSCLFERLVPPCDSELMARYRRAGLVTLGKTNLPELGLNFATRPVLFGACRNPWDLGRSPGGSSGGAAAAVASGMVPMAHASDAAGSIRQPASACGLFGFKPTRARTPTGPMAGEPIFGLAVEHALTRSVRDSAALLDATQGEDAGPPYGAPTPGRTFLAEVTSPPRQLRIAFSEEPWNGVAVSAEARSAVQRAARLCQDLGHIVEPARPEVDWGSFRFAFDAMVGAFTSQVFDVFCPRIGLEPGPHNVEAPTLALAAHGRSLSANQLATALGLRDQLSRNLGQFFQRHDVFLTPTMVGPALPLAALVFDGLERGTDLSAKTIFDQLFSVSPFTALANMTGSPAMSVPLHLSAEGLPVGAHFMAAFADDATLFRLAGQLEQAAPWSRRRPDCIAR
jgi:amidase